MGLGSEVAGVDAEVLGRLARALYATGRELHRAGSYGSLLERRALAGAMERPRVGDLVFVRERFDLDGVGELVRVEGEFPRERYVIVPLCRPGVQRVWSGCTVLALPDEAGVWLRDRVVVGRVR